MENLTRYFFHERIGSLLFIALGTTAILLAGWLVARGRAWRGAIVPLVLVGAIQLAVRSSVYLRTGQQVEGLTVGFALNGEDARAEELGRMKLVVSRFTVYKALEVGTMVLGILLLLRRASNPNFKSAGSACLVLGSLMLVLDLVAEARANKYIDWLNHLN